jgi:hypothetical protein
MISELSIVHVWDDHLWVDEDSATKVADRMAPEIMLFIRIASIWTYKPEVILMLVQSISSSSQWWIHTQKTLSLFWLSKVSLCSLTKISRLIAGDFTHCLWNFIEYGLTFYLWSISSTSSHSQQINSSIEINTLLGVYFAESIVSIIHLTVNVMTQMNR